MLQISQTENPTCSATIDQIRLRRATTLPVEFQNVSSSGFHSEIQLRFCSLTEIPFCVSDRRPVEVNETACEGHGGAPTGEPIGESANSDNWFRWTAAMASAPTIQASCQAATTQKEYELHDVIKYPECPSGAANRTENLRFAQFLCAAQQMSRRRRLYASGGFGRRHHRLWRGAGTRLDAELIGHQVPGFAGRFAIGHHSIGALLDPGDQIVLDAEHHVGIEIFVAVDEDVGDQRLIAR